MSGLALLRLDELRKKQLLSRYESCALSKWAEGWREGVEGVFLRTSQVMFDSSIKSEHFFTDTSRLRQHVYLFTVSELNVMIIECALKLIIFTLLRNLHGYCFKG